METLIKDFAYAVRTIGRSPMFALVAVLSLALGIGANTAIFTLVNALFLNPLPVEHPSELVSVQTVDERNVATAEWAARDAAEGRRFLRQCARVAEILPQVGGAMAQSARWKHDHLREGGSGRTTR